MMRDAFKALLSAPAGKTLLRCLAYCLLISALAAGTPARGAEAVRVEEGMDPSVLILPFAVHAAPGQAEQLRRDIPELLRSSLAAAGFRVITGKSGTKSPANDAGARTLASGARADYAVYGTLAQLGDAFSLDMRMVSSSTGEAYAYHAERNSLLELAPAVTELSEQARGAARGKGGIADIEIRGLRLIDPERVKVRLSSQVGGAVDEASADEDLRRIWEMGYFSDVRADLEQSPRGPVLVFTVVEKPRIDDVRVEGSDAVDMDDITEAMSSKTGDVLNDRVLAEDLQKITELYRKKGYYLADVTYDIQERTGGASAVLLLKVNEGNRLYIKEVSIEGLEQEDPDELAGKLSLKTRGLFSWITGSGVLKEEELERDSQLLQATLVNRGYIDARVAAPEVRYDDDGIRVIFRVSEGARYKLGQVGFSGDLIDTREKLLEQTHLDELAADGEYFNLETMQEDIKILTDFYSDYGYAFADIGVETTPRNDADGAFVDVTYTLNPKERVYIRRVEVEGNTKTRDNVILRELRLADGQPFSGWALRRSVERLDKLRYFDEVNPQLVPTGNPGEVDLKVGVKEGNTGSINVGFGYSTYDKFGIAGGISEANLFGQGYYLGLQGYTSTKETSVRATFINPRLYNSNLGLSFQLYAVEEEWTDFDKNTVGGRVNFMYPLGEYTTLNWGYRLDRYTLSNIEPWATSIIRDYEGTNWASVASVGIGRDSTNSPTFPSRGTREGITLEYGGGGLGGDDNFFKVTGEYGFFYGLVDNHVIHAKVSAGAVFRNTDDSVPVFERFFLGGMNSLRGYSDDDVSPRDPRTGEHIGGDRMGYATLEYIWAFKPDAGLALVPFYDVGFNSDSARESLFNKIYQSVGLELRWRSPMGDLRFAYGWPLSENVDGKSRNKGRFEFSMGQGF